MVHSPSALRLDREGLAAAGFACTTADRTKAVIDRVDALTARSCEGRRDAPVLGTFVPRPWQLRREARAYERLAGLEGIPRLVGVVDRQAIALQFIDGRRCGPCRADRSTRSSSIGSKLWCSRCTAAAWRTATSITATSWSGRTTAVSRDFSTSWIGGPESAWPARRIFEQMCRADCDRSPSCARTRRGAPPEPPRPRLYRLVAKVRDRLRL